MFDLPALVVPDLLSFRSYVKNLSTKFCPSRAYSCFVVPELLTTRHHTLAAGMIQSCQVIKIEPIFILPLHLAFIGEVVYPRLWSTAGNQYQNSSNAEKSSLPHTPSLLRDSLVRLWGVAEFKPNGPVLLIAPTTSRSQRLSEHSLILLLWRFWTQTKKLKPLPQKEFHPLLLCTCSVFQQYAIKQMQGRAKSGDCAGRR